jgi:preprotein translocase subunit YajC
MSSYLKHVGVNVHGLILASSTTTTTVPKKTTNTSSELLIFALIFAAAYFLFIRPRSQRMKRQQQQRQTATIGDEVMLTSGIIGRVTTIDGDRATIEIAPEIEVEVVLRAIGQVLVPADAELSLDVPPDPGHDAGDDDDEEYDEDDDDDQDDHDPNDDDQDDDVADQADRHDADADGAHGPGEAGDDVRSDAGHLGADGLGQ